MSCIDIFHSTDQMLDSPLKSKWTAGLCMHGYSIHSTHLKTKTWITGQSKFFVVFQNQNMGWRRTQVELFYCMWVKQKTVSHFTVYASHSNVLSEMSFEVEGRDSCLLMSILTEESSWTASTKDLCNWLLRGWSLSFSMTSKNLMSSFCIDV